MERQFSDLIILLASGINQRRMYFDAHPRVKAVSLDFSQRLDGLVERSGQEEFSFGVFGGKFIRHGKYLVGPSIAGRSLIEFAERLGCGGFVFHQPLAVTEVATFFRLGAAQKDKLAGLEEAKALFAAHGIEHIHLADPLSEGGDSGPENADARETEAISDFMASDFTPLLDVYQALYETVAGNCQAIMQSEDLDMARARSSGEKLVDVSAGGAMDVMQFMRYPDYDSYTIGHSVRVAALASMLGRALGYPPAILGELATAGLVHDVGKGHVPEEILFKADKLDPEEMKIVESHPTLGAQILLASGEKGPMIISAAWGHHIREDGRGYPIMPAWFKRGQAASLIHICDVFEALTAVRPYKAPMAPRRAFEIMLKDKGSYHPAMLARFIRTMGIYPPGSEVRLTDNRKAVVVGSGVDMEHPQIRVTHDAGGLPLRNSDQPAIKLEPGGEIGIEEFLLVGTANVVPAGAPVEADLIPLA
jgi:putative nucleotidyltransferase with HDIG domain